MKLITKTLSCILTASLLLTLVPGDIKAAPAGMTYDESVYVNLDYYGKTQDMNIVKGCSLNGNTSFTDFGDYDKVTNMSNEAKPDITGNQLNWKLPEGTERFYYECTPKSGSVTLPWDFDVSYKLNGTPVNADKLAGASGLVEININAKPNNKASNYLKNNMLLMIEANFDMSDTTSVEAPGAQVQAAGTYKAVVFAALPGEEKSYTIRVGTKSFETTGIIMTMVPATLDQLDKIKDIKDAKDTFEDSGDSIYKSLNELLSTIESTSNGLNGLKSGLNSLDSARNTISTSKNKVYADADKSLADLTTITNQISALVPHLQNGQNLVKDINGNLNLIVDNMESLKTDINKYKTSINKMQDDMNSLNKVLDELKSYSNTREDLRKDAIKAINNVEDDIESMHDGLVGMAKSLGALKTGTGNLDKAMKAMPAQLDAVAAYNNQTVNILNTELKSILVYGEPVLQELEGVIESTDELVIGLSHICKPDNDKDDDSLTDIAQRAINIMDKYMVSIESGITPAQELITEVNTIGDTTKSVLDKGKTLIDSVNDLNNTINKYQDGAVNTLKDTETLFNGFGTGLTDVKGFLTTLESTLKTSGKNLDEGTKKSLASLIDLLQKSLNGVGTTSTLRNTNDTIKKTYDDKIGDIEDDSNLLNIDSSASRVSFTSPKNPAPQSIQVIMRTHEISIDDAEKANTDLEASKDNSGFLARIAQIFQKLWLQIASLKDKLLMWYN